MRIGQFVYIRGFTKLFCLPVCCLCFFCNQTPELNPSRRELSRTLNRKKPRLKVAFQIEPGH